MTSATCSLPSCRRVTRDASGRCHDHRGAGKTTSPRLDLPLPVRPGLKTYCRVLDGGRREEWRNEDGVFHREDGPALVICRGDGTVDHEEWRVNGRYFRRDGGPTKVDYTRDGVTPVVEAHTDFNGANHRTDGPAVTAYEDGRKVVETWWTTGVYRRLDGPAMTRFREDGSVQVEEWARRGKVHRIGGPARTTYAEDGTVEETHFLLGERYDSAEAVLAEISTWDAARCTKMWADESWDVDALSKNEVFAHVAFPAYAEVLGDDVGSEAIYDALVGGIRTPEGVREVAGGAPLEWVRAFEESRP